MLTHFIHQCHNKHSPQELGILWRACLQKLSLNLLTFELRYAPPKLGLHVRICDTSAQAPKGHFVGFRLQVGTKAQVHAQAHAQLKRFLRSLQKHPHHTQLYLWHTPAPFGEVLGHGFLVHSQKALPLDALNDSWELLQWRLERSAFVSTTPCYHRLWDTRTFEEKLVQEVSRSRRIKLPTALAVFKLASANAQTREQGLCLHFCMRLLGQMVLEHSRSSDIVGFIDPMPPTKEQILGICLPHTPPKGACLKAEALRRMLGQELKKLLPHWDASSEASWAASCRIEVGLSSYPQFCQDAKSLIHSALGQIKRYS